MCASCSAADMGSSQLEQPLLTQQALSQLRWEKTCAQLQKGYPSTLGRDGRKSLVGRVQQHQQSWQLCLTVRTIREHVPPHGLHWPAGSGGRCRPVAGPLHHQAVLRCSGAKDGCQPAIPPGVWQPEWGWLRHWLVHREGEPGQQAERRGGCRHHAMRLHLHHPCMVGPLCRSCMQQRDLFRLQLIILSSSNGSF